MNSVYDKPVGSEVVLLVAGRIEAGTAATVYKDATITSLPVTFLPLAANGPTSVRFTPTSNGLHYVSLQDGTIIAQADVVTRTSASILRNIEDEALGSWSWDRANGTLQLLRQDGSVLADFAVVDTQTISSRERLL